MLVYVLRTIENEEKALTGSSTPLGGTPSLGDLQFSSQNGQTISGAKSTIYLTFHTWGMIWWLSFVASLLRSLSEWPEMFCMVTATLSFHSCTAPLYLGSLIRLSVSMTRSQIFYFAWMPRKADRPARGSPPEGEPRAFILPIFYSLFILDNLKRRIYHLIDSTCSSWKKGYPRFPFPI